MTPAPVRFPTDFPHPASRAESAQRALGRSRIGPIRPSALSAPAAAARPAPPHRFCAPRSRN